MTVDEHTTSATGGGLKRELKVVDAAAFSIGLIGPVGAAALLGTGAAGASTPGALTTVNEPVSPARTAGVERMRRA